MSDILKLIITVLIVGLVIALFVAFPAMLLWNYFAPVLGLPLLTFWQMVAVAIFLRLMIPTSSTSDK